MQEDFRTEAEELAYNAGRFGLPVKQAGPYPCFDWAPEERLGHYSAAIWPRGKHFFCITECPDGTWLIERRNERYKFSTRMECWAYAVGRNWCGIKDLRGARNEQCPTYAWKSEQVWA